MTRDPDEPSDADDTVGRRPARRVALLIETSNGYSRQLLAGAGKMVNVFKESARAATDVEGTLSRIGDWLLSLPKPVAVFACYDARGRQVIDECHRVGLRMPDDVAVLGVDDDELLCSLMTPPLSSIIPDARGAGRLAGELLDRLIDGGTAHTENLLPPLGIAVRRSTDTLAVDDPLIAAIATRCGFRHPEYMTVAFTKRYGISPSEWRKGHRRD